MKRRGARVMRADRFGDMLEETAYGIRAGRYDKNLERIGHFNAAARERIHLAAIQIKYALAKKRAPHIQFLEE